MTAISADAGDKKQTATAIPRPGDGTEIGQEAAVETLRRVTEGSTTMTK